jgi:hypothetical protein
MKQRALIGTKGIFGIILYKPASLILLLTDEEWSQLQTKYGIKLLASSRIIQVEAVENTRWISYNRNPDNKLITLNIIALTNITLIETSVSVFYLLAYYSIYYPPLLCTSWDVSKICLPPIYNPIESSPDDQIQPKLFVSINSIDIYISSDKFVLNKLISMEVRFNTFPLLWWCDNFVFNS